MSVQDIFDFWAECPADARIHPQDEPVFGRPFLADKLGFNLKCLPTCFAGPLKTAPVVLLYLSPGLDEKWDLAEADTEAGQARYAAQRSGSQPLPSEDEAKPHFDWWSSRTKIFDLPVKVIRHNVAILNLGAYHSKAFNGQLGLAALPSCRVTLDWAHEVLFSAAMKGERVVVCMRSAASWGLESGSQFGEALFAPPTVRGGHMRKKEEEHSAFRERVIEAVRNVIDANGVQP